MNVICFDLEGPLSPQDNAFEVMGLIPNGKKIFEVLSRYDDLLALDKREGYQPGDTLSLIVPFLVKYNVKSKDIKRISDKAGIVAGAKELIALLKKQGWKVYIISTSYEPHALNIAGKLDVARENVYCTPLPLEKFSSGLKRKDSNLIGELENVILNDLSTRFDDEKILEVLDVFFWDKMAKTDIGKMMSEVKVVGGARKAEAMRMVSIINDTLMGEIISVGDSITDTDLLGDVKRAGGVSIAFNSNSYAIPNATVALTCSSILPLYAFTEAYSGGGVKESLETVDFWESNADVIYVNPENIPKNYLPEKVKNLLLKHKGRKDFIWPAVHNLINASQDKLAMVAEKHKIAREFVRGHAAKLG
ncbi:MAG: hypothetical protein ABH950_07215 [Candidatus Altiarchaeota archaeon]